MFRKTLNLTNFSTSSNVWNPDWDKCEMSRPCRSKHRQEALNKLVSELQPSKIVLMAGSDRKMTLWFWQKQLQFDIFRSYGWFHKKPTVNTLPSKRENDICGGKPCSATRFRRAAAKVPLCEKENDMER